MIFYWKEKPKRIERKSYFYLSLKMTRIVVNTVKVRNGRFKSPTSGVILNMFTKDYLLTRTIIKSSLKFADHDEFLARTAPFTLSPKINYYWFFI